MIKGSIRDALTLIFFLDVVLIVLLIFVQERHLLMFLMQFLHSKIIDIPKILRQIKVAAGISFISFDFLLVSSD